MKFLCDEQTNDNYLPRGKLLAIKSQREFLSFLRQHGKICPDDVSYLVWLLRNVGLKELADSIAEQGKIVAGTRVQMDLLRLHEALNVLFFMINTILPTSDLSLR